MTFRVSLFELSLCFPYQIRLISDKDIPLPVMFINKQIQAKTTQSQHNSHPIHYVQKNQQNPIADHQNTEVILPQLVEKVSFVYTVSPEELVGKHFHLLILH